MTIVNQTSDAPPDWAAITRDYAEGVLTVNEICAAHSISRSQLYYRSRAENWPLRRAFSRAARRRAQLDLTDRLVTALSLKMSEFENRMSGCAGAALKTAADSERDARTLNTLVRLFEKLKSIDEKSQAAAPLATLARPNKAGTIKRHANDADRIRTELANRFEKLQRELRGEAACE